MARKWMFSFFFILGIFKSYESGKVSEILMDSPQGSTDKNLTAIKWAHAVNSQHELKMALQNDIQMIEADIVLGRLINDSSNVIIPVMGHPPANESDLSLKNFLSQILEHNKKTESKKKGVKLDFKSTEVFQGSIEILQTLWPHMNYPIWLNADIIKGPVNQTETKPVDAEIFLKNCKNFDNATLSIGWTTKWGINYTEGIYADSYIMDMVEAVKKNGITGTKQKITFPVRAGIAALSKSQLHNLVKELNATNDVTLTIWSSHQDNVDIEKLRDLIFSFGLDRIYLDVPQEVSSKLDLSNVPNGSLMSFASFGILSLCLVFVSVFKEIQY